MTPDTLILTMYFLWSKGENKFHFSIFWKPVICTQEIQGKKSLSLWQKVEMINCTSSIIPEALQQQIYSKTTGQKASLAIHFYKMFDLLHTDYKDSHHRYICTFECLIQLVFSKNDPQVMNSACVKLHPEYHVSARATVALVVALKL